MLWVRALASFVFSLDSFFSFSVGTTDNGWAAVLYVLHNYFWSCVKLLLLSSVHYTFYLCIYKHIEKLWLKSEFLVFCVSESEIFQLFSNHQRLKPRWAYSKSIPISSKGLFSFHKTQEMTNTKNLIPEHNRFVIKIMIFIERILGIISICDEFAPWRIHHF